MFFFECILFVRYENIGQRLLLQRGDLVKDDLERVLLAVLCLEHEARRQGSHGVLQLDHLHLEQWLMLRATIGAAPR